MLYNIHVMVYKGVIYNKPSSQVLCDLTHDVSIILAIYIGYDHRIERPLKDFFETFF